MNLMKQGGIDRSDGFGVQYRIDRPRSRIHRQTVTSRKDAKSRDMIHMFMCDQNSLHLFRFQINRIQTGFNPLSADSSIHQNMAFICSHADTVATAAACYTA